MVPNDLYAERDASLLRVAEIAAALSEEVENYSALCRVANDLATEAIHAELVHSALAAPSTSKDTVVGAGVATNAARALRPLLGSG